MSLVIPNASYRCPQDLAVTANPLRRVMVIGGCLVSIYPGYIERVENCSCDFFLVNNASLLPETPPHPVAEYDFQLVHVPLRAIMPDQIYFRLSYADSAAYEEAFRTCRARLAAFVEGAMRWCARHGLLTFVFNFLLPQQNPAGRLLPRYDLRNAVHFIEKLNEALAEEVAQYRNAYLFDQDQVAATMGRRYVQDDAVWVTSHNSILGDGDFEPDGERLDGPQRASEVYGLAALDFIQASWSEIRAMHRTILQIDQVKLVIVDLDDTLWRGVAAEQTERSESATEGWPIGVVEALSHLRRRGVLLALVSKNDEARVAEIWKQHYPGRLGFDDFAVRKINWRPKPENIEELLGQVNLLPHNVVFIDDNPVERAAVAQAFPDIRTFGPNPLLWRRILLWSAETQVATITAESAARTEMIQAQVVREEQRQRLSRDDFLASLGVKLRLFEIGAVDHRAFPRAIELINKTNQFNTTGRRWTESECRLAFDKGDRFVAFEVEDRFTAYGIVGILVVEEAHIAQFVMSCRVAGLDVEVAAVAELLRLWREAGVAAVRASLVETPLNLLCRDLYERCGFAETGGEWRREALPPLAPPPHVVIVSSLPAPKAPPGPDVARGAQREDEIEGDRRPAETGGICAVTMLAPAADDTPGTRHPAWHDIESDNAQRFRWTSEREIRWKIPTLPASYNGVRFVVPVVMQITEAFAAGCAIEFGGFARPANRHGQMLFADFALRGDEQNEVVLLTPAPMSPRELRGAPDDRRLGLAVRAMDGSPGA